jgi:hypothetical protein
MSTTAVEPIEWTQRTRDLWTGRRSDAPAGTIERGTRFTYVDLDGEPHSGYRSLAEAQEAASHPGSVCGSRGRGLRVHPLVVALIAGAAAADLVVLGGMWLVRL